LEEVPEHGEYKYGKRTEASESYQIATYGKLFAITRQTIINDDLGALTDIPSAHGESAARKVGDVAYAVLTANAAMGDGVALFHAGHSNFIAGGSGAVPGVATIGAGILSMGTQKDLQDKRRLNIRPEFFLAPKALEGTAEVFFRSERFVDSDTVATDSSLSATRVNPYSGQYFTRVYDARLDDDDAAAWYLAARKGKTITVFFLNGQRTPFMETKQGWTVDGVEYKVRIDCGAKAVDWRGLYMNDGN
jgi:phage major head subunit gpT-like protein